ncbi:MAG: HD domain-containing protein [Lachnospiraceae bacterium]
MMKIPTSFERKKLFEKYGTPPAVQAHCNAVASKALLLASEITSVPVNIRLLQAACQLHDIARHMEGNHALQGARLLYREGYSDVAEIVAVHHDLPAKAALEAQLLYLADKLVLGTESVSLEQRFAASKGKCRTAKARESWQRRRRDAFMVMEQYQLNVEN